MHPEIGFNRQKYYIAANAAILMLINNCRTVLTPPVVRNTIT